MATPKHTEPPSLVSTQRKKHNEENSNTCHMSTVIDRFNCRPEEALLRGVMVKTVNVIIYT